MMYTENLREWLEKLILRFREEVAKLPPDKQSILSEGLDDFSEPCQLLLIWLVNPEWQILLIVRSSNLEDGLIEVYGPAEFTRFHELVESKALTSEIVKQAGKENVELNLALAENFDIPSSIISDGPKIITKRRVSQSPYASLWLIRGNISHLNIREEVDKLIKDITVPTNSDHVEKIILEGYGAYIYPRIWIGEFPPPTNFGERVLGRHPLSVIPKVVFQDKYKGRTLIARQDGYLGVEGKDKTVALDILNEIMSFLFYNDISNIHVMEYELSEFSLNEDHQFNMNFNFRLPRYREHLQKMLAGPIERLINLYPLGTTRIDEERFNEIIRMAERVMSDRKVKACLKHLHNAHIYFGNQDYGTSFLMAWMVIEGIYIRDLKSKYNLPNTSLDRLLKILREKSILSNIEYEVLDKFRQIRNSLVHEGKTPTAGETEDCLRLTKNIVKKYVDELLRC